MTQNEGWNSPTEQSGHRSDTLLGELVALRPVDPNEQTMDTSMGESTARFVEALIITPDGPQPYRNLGELPIFWQVVRRQLNDANPWIVGRIRQSTSESGKTGRAYRMFPASSDEAGAINTALRRHRDEPIPLETLPGESTENGPDESPL